MYSITARASSNAAVNVAVAAAIRSAVMPASRAMSSTIDGSSSEPKPQPAQLTNEQKARICEMLRVNHAGEIGANGIYAGQAAVFARRKDPELTSMIEHMWDQEKTHLKVFDSVLAENRVRPSLLRPFWEAAGFALGAGTALMGKEAAMACTEAVETVIGNHYNDQIRELLQLEQDDDIKKLTEVLRQFRDDELEHLDTAVEQNAKDAPGYSILTNAIHGGCKAAIWVASRI
eukprot:jgi/Hompol1/4633/HPOL_003772-RA